MCVWVCIHTCGACAYGYMPVGVEELTIICLPQLVSALFVFRPGLLLDLGVL